MLEATSQSNSRADRLSFLCHLALKTLLYSAEYSRGGPAAYSSHSSLELCFGHLGASVPTSLVTHDAKCRDSLWFCHGALAVINRTSND